MVKKSNQSIVRAIIPGLVPAIFVGVGAALGSTLKVPPKASASLMALAAGFITASFITDVAPEISSPETNKGKISAFLGVLGGALLMIGLQVGEQKMGKDIKKNGSVWGLVAATCVDFFIDSVLVGQTMKVGNFPSVMMLAATSVEAITLSAAIVTAMKERGESKRSIIIAASSIAFSSVLGVTAGYKTSNFFTGNRETFMMGLAATVLLWMVVRELLPQAERSVGSRWWIPVAWLGSTALGLGVNWISEGGK